MSIEAMKLALEALDKYGFAPCDKEEDWQGFKQAIAALRAAIEQAEKQEPVAWGFQNTGITGSNRWMYLRETIPEEDQYRGVLWTPLYTAPPQREWQGLTDEDLEFWAGELNLGELGRGVLRAVNAHLKERNT